MKSYSIEEINEVLQGVIIGSTSQKIIAAEQLEIANDSQISL